MRAVGWDLRSGYTFHIKVLIPKMEKYFISGFWANLTGDHLTTTINSCLLHKGCMRGRHGASTKANRGYTNSFQPRQNPQVLGRSKIARELILHQSAVCCSIPETNQLDKKRENNPGSITTATLPCGRRAATHGEVTRWNTIGNTHGFVGVKLLASRANEVARSVASSPDERKGPKKGPTQTTD